MDVRVCSWLWVFDVFRTFVLWTHGGSTTLDDGALCVRDGYTSIYYCCKSFAVLLYHMVGGCIASCVSPMYYVLLYCCSTGLWVGRSVRSCGVLLSCVHTGSWVNFSFFFFLPLYRSRAGIVQHTTSRYVLPAAVRG